MKLSSTVNHPPRVKMAADNHALVAPIYQSVKFSFTDLEQMQRLMQGERSGFYYSRVANPTVQQLELTLAQLQQRAGCVLTPSGVAAMSVTLQALCQAGDHLILFAEGYAPTRAMVRRVLTRFGVHYTILSIEDLAAIEHVLSTTPTRLMAFESPTNPILKVADLERLTALAKQYGALTVLDNTLAGVHAHAQYPIDVYVHSLTKYTNGHGDVMAGAVLADAPVLDQIRAECAALGMMLDPHAAFLIQRGLKTYALRYERAASNALALAQFFTAHPAIEKVRYPGLSAHPQYALAQLQMQDGGGVVTINIHGGAAAAQQFVAALKLFTITASLGSTESLVLPPEMLQAHDLTGPQQTWAQIADNTVRLAVGIEDIADLRADVEQALAAIS